MPSPEDGATQPAASPREQHVAPVVPAPERLHRDRCAFRPDRPGVREPGAAAELGHGAADAEALMGGAGADADDLAVREHPAVEVGRQRPVVDDVATHRIDVRVVRARRLDDLVVGEDALQPVRALHGRASDLRLGPVRPDHVAGAHASTRPAGNALARAAVAPLGACALASLAVLDDDGPPVRFAERGERAGRPRRPGPRRPRPEPLVEAAAIDHADVADLDRHVDGARARRDHARGLDLGLEDVARHVEVLEHLRRHGSAAGLDAAGAIEQQHAVTVLDELVRRRRPGRPPADDDDVVERCVGGGRRGGFVLHRCAQDCVSSAMRPTGKGPAPSGAAGR